MKKTLFIFLLLASANLYSETGSNQIFGLSLEEIEKSHTETGYGDTGRIFDEKYEVTIWDGYAKRIKLDPVMYNSENHKEGIKESESLIPKDSEFIEELQHSHWTYLTVRFYKSDSLIEKRKNDKFKRDTKDVFSIQYISNPSLARGPHDDFFVITFED